jgi:DNA-binding XRE family transcriptional regulator
MEIDWPREFNDQLDRLELDMSPRGRKRLQLLTFMLKRLRDLEEAPVQDTAMIKRVRQSRKHLVWPDRPLARRNEGTMMGKKDFVRGNDRVERLLRQPDIADAVAALETEADDLDRVHAMSLAMVREAGKRTQAEIAHELGISQGAVSQMERREDMLLSTLRSYITATGAENPRIIVTVNGRDVELAI